MSITKILNTEMSKSKEDYIQLLSKVGLLRRRRKVLKSFQDFLMKIRQYGGKAVTGRVAHMITTNNNLTL